jgi:hypothetical protein
LHRDEGDRHSDVDDEQGIYRDEVLEIVGALADISSDTLAILRGEEGDDGEEEMDSLRVARVPGGTRGEDSSASGTGRANQG